MYGSPLLLQMLLLLPLLLLVVELLLLVDALLVLEVVVSRDPWGRRGENSRRSRRTGRRRYIRHSRHTKASKVLFGLCLLKGMYYYKEIIVVITPYTIITSKRGWARKFSFAAHA